VAAERREAAGLSFPEGGPGFGAAPRPPEAVVPPLYGDAVAVDARTSSAVLHPGASACAVMVQQGDTGPRDCGGAPTHAAEVAYAYDGSVWLVFFCADHLDVLPDGVRDLTDSDRVVLNDRRQRRSDALAGRPWTPPVPLRPGHRRNLAPS
jgi:hypothetical protein